MICGFSWSGSALVHARGSLRKGCEALSIMKAMGIVLLWLLARTPLLRLFLDFVWCELGIPAARMEKECIPFLRFRPPSSN